MERKFSLPGSFLAGSEEFVNGENTFTDKDEIYSAVIGESAEDGRKISVHARKSIVEVKEGTPVYCMVKEVYDNRAVVECLPVEENGRGAAPFTAALMVTDIRMGYVKVIRDEMRIGDILKARVTVTKPSFEVTTVPDECGVIAAFCSKCRNKMDLNGMKLICNKCGSMENRKLAR